MVDIRNLGLVGAIELQPRPGRPGERAMAVFLECWRQGLLVRTTGDTIALSPPLIIKPEQVDEMISIVSFAIEQCQ